MYGRPTTVAINSNNFSQETNLFTKERIPDFDFESPTTVNLLSKDLKAASKIMTRAQVRYLVDTYYQMQEQKKRENMHVTSLEKVGEPNSLSEHFANNFTILEAQARNSLDKYSGANTVGIWMRSQKGIGPVIAAGFLAHLDITKAPTAGHFWSFAGLTNRPWLKGQVRPFNMKLKTLCWNMGECFVKVSGYEDAYYGIVYKERKVVELARNEAGDFAEQAKAILAAKNFSKDTDAYAAYSTGKLPPAHLHARAKRYAVKLFLSHLHSVMYQEHYKMPAPTPYVIAFLDHAHYIAPPNYPVV
jgi:hypothetical protein